MKKNQETDGYGRDKRPGIGKLKMKEATMSETRKKLKRRQTVACRTHSSVRLPCTYGLRGEGLVWGAVVCLLAAPRVQYCSGNG